MNCKVIVDKETSIDYGNGWELCLQYCQYTYDNGNPTEKGYRFIYKENGKLKPQRAQARIPSFCEIHELMAKAVEQGWGHHVND